MDVRSIVSHSISYLRSLPLPSQLSTRAKVACVALGGILLVSTLLYFRSRSSTNDRPDEPAVDRPETPATQSQAEAPPPEPVSPAATTSHQSSRTATPLPDASAGAAPAIPDEPASPAAATSHQSSRTATPLPDASAEIVLARMVKPVSPAATTSDESSRTTTPQLDASSAGAVPAMTATPSTDVLARVVGIATPRQTRTYTIREIAQGRSGFTTEDNQQYLCAMRCTIPTNWKPGDEIVVSQRLNLGFGGTIFYFRNETTKGNLVYAKLRTG